MSRVAGPCTRAAAPAGVRTPVPGAHPPLRLRSPAAAPRRAQGVRSSNLRVPTIAERTPPARAVFRWCRLGVAVRSAATLAARGPSAVRHRVAGRERPRRICRPSGPASPAAVDLPGRKGSSFHRRLAPHHAPIRTPDREGGVHEPGGRPMHTRGGASGRPYAGPRGPPAPPATVAGRCPSPRPGGPEFKSPRPDHLQTFEILGEGGFLLGLLRQPWALAFLMLGRPGKCEAGVHTEARIQAPEMGEGGHDRATPHMADVATLAEWRDWRPLWPRSPRRM